MPSPPNKQTLFFTTRWTLVRDAAKGGDTEATEALSQLFETYWQPLYRYVRRSGKSQQDAEDLIQGFFTQLLSTDGLRLADKDRGSFRSFLLGSLKNHMAKQWQHDHRLKRGGFSPHLSIDWKDGETGLSIEPADPATPDRLFDRDWAMALLDKVLDDLSKSDHGQDFDRWKPFLSISSGKLAYAEIAEAFGMTEGAARVAVHRLRKRYRQHLRDEISRTLSDSESVDEEMSSLFAALSE
ncbi:RNA polymerase sigma factor [Haloferula sp.]|uniref:RNA polymerase sigma factor n=1 Tax=Haloferula sp. TaxID=2497595 RepID=UPI003C76FE8E